MAQLFHSPHVSAQHVLKAAKSLPSFRAWLRLLKCQYFVLSFPGKILNYNGF